MIVITTPTGQIGRQVLGNLLDSGEQLRVIARDPSKLPAGVRKDLTIILLAGIALPGRRRTGRRRYSNAHVLGARQLAIGCRASRQQAGEPDRN